MKFDIPRDWCERAVKTEGDIGAFSVHVYDAYKPCPACRGYNLERQWCSVCDTRGFVTNGEPKP